MAWWLGPFPKKVKSTFKPSQMKKGVAPGSAISTTNVGALGSPYVVISKHNRGCGLKSRGTFVCDFTDMFPVVKDVNRSR